MKLYYFVLILFYISNCQPDKKTINVKEYICPKLGVENKLLYEYEGSNEEVYPLKYMLIERDSNLTNSYTYTFLDSEFELLSGYIEVRQMKFTELKKMIILDVNSNNEKTVQEVEFDRLKIPYQLEMNKAIEFATEWKSKSQDNLKYNQKSSRKLIEISESLNYLGNPIKAIVIQTNDLIEISNSENVYKQVAESEMIAKYGIGIGLIIIEVKFSNNLTSKAKLKSIHRGKEIDLIRLRSKNRI